MALHIDKTASPDGGAGAPKSRAERSPRIVRGAATAMATREAEIAKLLKDRKAISRMAARLFEFYSDELGGVPLSTVISAESLIEDVLLAAVGQ
jgi:hypothetical protein